MIKNLVLALIAATTILCGNVRAEQNQPILPGDSPSVRKVTLAQIYRYAREMYRYGKYPEAIKAFKEMLSIECTNEIAQYHLMKIARSSPEYSDLNAYLNNLPCQLHNFEEEDFLPASLYYETDVELMQEQLGYYNKRYRIAKDSLENAAANYANLTKELEEEIFSLRKQLDARATTAKNNKAAANNNGTKVKATPTSAEIKPSKPVAAAKPESVTIKKTAQAPTTKTGSAETLKPKAKVQASLKTTETPAKISSTTNTKETVPAASSQGTEIVKTQPVGTEAAKGTSTKIEIKATVETPAGTPKVDQTKAAGTKEPTIPEAKTVTLDETATKKTAETTVLAKIETKATSNQSSAETKTQTEAKKAAAEAAAMKAAEEKAKAEVQKAANATAQKAAEEKAKTAAKNAAIKAAAEKANAEAKQTAQAKKAKAAEAKKAKAAAQKAAAENAAKAAAEKAAQAKAARQELAMSKIDHDTFLKMDQAIAELKSQLAEERIRHQDEMVSLRQAEMRSKDEVSAKEEELATLEQKFAKIQARLRSIEEAVKNKNAAIQALQKEVDAATAERGDSSAEADEEAGVDIIKEKH